MLTYYHQASTFNDMLTLLHGTEEKTFLVGKAAWMTECDKEEWTVVTLNLGHLRSFPIV